MAREHRENIKFSHIVIFRVHDYPFSPNGAVPVDQAAGERADDEVRGAQGGKSKPARRGVEAEESSCAVVGTVASKLPRSRAWASAASKAERSRGSVRREREDGDFARAMVGRSLDSLTFSVHTRAQERLFFVCVWLWMLVTSLSSSASVSVAVTSRSPMCSCCCWGLYEENRSVLRLFSQ